VVVPGDTLWDIAAEVLETDDQRAIARYWPRIHKENLDIVGRDPNLIRPGQVLALPPKEEA
jgi:nucleoid-associated protein YgaU